MGRKKRDDVEQAELVEEPRERTRAARGLPLQREEEAIMSASPSAAANFYKYIYTLGFYELWRRSDTAVVTSRRLLISRGIFNREERSIAMSHVEGARYVRRGLNSYAQVTIVDRGGRKSERIGPMSARAARRFVAEVLQRI